MVAPARLLGPVTGRAAEQPLEYPYSDGKILMETDPHADSIVDMRYQLKTHFEARQDVYVAGSMALYYREGDPSAMLAPDLFVVLGVEKKERRSYMLWEEGGVVPAFVVEVASQSTSRLDAASKRATYERMGVREYWRFDPLGELIREGLVGWRLAAGSYEQVRAGRAGSGAMRWGWSCGRKGGCCASGIRSRGGPWRPIRRPCGRCRQRSASATRRSRGSANWRPDCGRRTCLASFLPVGTAYGQAPRQDGAGSADRRWACRADSDECGCTRRLAACVQPVTMQAAAGESDSRYARLTKGQIWNVGAPPACELLSV